VTCCASYTEPRLAAVYDTLNPREADTDFYLGLAGEIPLAVLDAGCGTGLLATAFAARGHHVTGADPAPAMLDVARKRQGADKVRWVDATAAGLALDARFDLIVMTGHVFQVFLDDEAVHAALSALRRHLAPAGRLAFESRNPIVREWEDWVPERTLERLALPDGTAVEVHYDIAAVHGDLVSFRTHFRFAGEAPVVTTSTLRFMSRGQIARHLEAAGFARVEWLGGWDHAPLTGTSPEIIAIAGT
jgi:SAM-dependent methyltransferase